MPTPSALIWFASTLSAFAAPEVCDGIDNDGDGATDEGPVAGYPDTDGDGAGDRAVIVWAADCSLLPADAISDGSDCNDADDTVIPGAGELADANGIDDDCEGGIDEGTSLWNNSCDMLSDDNSTFVTCDVPRIWSVADTQCTDHGYHLATIDDSSENYALYYPLNSTTSVSWIRWWFGLYDDGTDWLWTSGAPSYENWFGAEPSTNGDQCAGLYEYNGDWDPFDCDTQRPYLCEADCLYRSAYADDDGDGLGDPGDAISVCELPAGRVWNAGDCDDGDETISVWTWYVDTDEDHYGTDVIAGVGCAVLPESSVLSGDCDDGLDAVNPAADELCDLGEDDEDCDGLVNDADTSMLPASMLDWYPDADGDHYGDGEPVRSCRPPSDGYASIDGDCDDGDGTIHPEAEEICDGSSQDCDPEIDEGLDVSVWYVDEDGDGYGDDSLESFDGCGPPEPTGYSELPGDCDDSSSDRHPDNTEIPGDGVDQDCDEIDATVDSPDGGGDERPRRDGRSYKGEPPVLGCACDLPAPSSSPRPWLALLLFAVTARRRSC